MMAQEDFLTSSGDNKREVASHLEEQFTSRWKREGVVKKQPFPHNQQAPYLDYLLISSWWTENAIGGGKGKRRRNGPLQEEEEKKCGAILAAGVTS